MFILLFSRETVFRFCFSIQSFTYLTCKAYAILNAIHKLIGKKKSQIFENDFFVDFHSSFVFVDFKQKKNQI